MKSMGCGLMECLEGIRNPCKLLKRWSGRRDSNPRRPAWEDDCKLETKTFAFPASRSGDTGSPVFALRLRVAPKRSTNGAHERTLRGHGIPLPLFGKTL